MEKLKPHELNLVYKSYDIVGEIAIIRVHDTIKHNDKLIAEAIIRAQKRVKTVLRQTSPVSGELRLRHLELVEGERKTETIHRENGCSFKVDVEKCYFSSRLSYERMRIAKQIQSGETVVNMFAGVGCYSIIIAKHSRAEKIFSIDVNPSATQYAKENIRINKVEQRVEHIQGDAKRVIQEKLLHVADRVLMPLPEKAYEYLDYAVLALKTHGGWIHYYDFEHAQRDEDPIGKIELKVSKKLQEIVNSFEVVSGRIVRRVGPNWFQIVLDISVKS